MRDVAGSFDLFCDEYVFIQDKESRRAIRFKRYPCQKDFSDRLVRGEWIVVLKPRQLGITWECAVYSAWCLVTKPMFQTCVIAQNRDYARDFLRRVRFVYQRLPDWMQIPIVSDSRYEMAFGHAPGEESEVRVVAGCDSAGRSLTADLVVFDEQSRIPMAKEAREACEPSVEVAGGQIIVVSTSAGPHGDFYELWCEAPDNGYEKVFYRWDARPGRDAKWYARQKERHKSNPLWVPREYPSNPEEAFLYAEGRCFPTFGREQHIRCWDELPYAKREAYLYRGIDFGSSAPFAVVWIAHWPNAISGLTIDPSCENSIRELLGYHYDPATKDGRERPAKEHDHAIDALRYAVVEFHLDGHVHIYRELYVPNSTSKGRTDLDDIDEIHRLSGWVEAEAHEGCRYKPGPGGECFQGTVTDPSLGKTIELYNANDLICLGYRRPKETPVNANVIDGISRVNLLVDGTRDISKKMVMTEEQCRERILSKPRRHRLSGNVGLQEASYREMTRREMVAKRRRRIQRMAMRRYRPC